MARPKGLPKTGGRAKGVKNKRTRAVEAASQEAAERLSEVIPDAFQGDAHALLMAVYKDPSQPMPIRLDAAGKAIKFEKPSLSSVDSSGEAVKRAVVRVPHKAATGEEWQQHYAPTTTQ